MITKMLVYDHRGRTKPGEDGPIELRITHNRKPYYIATGVKVKGTEFCGGRIVGRPDCDVLQERLDIMVHRIEEAVNECLKNDLSINVAEIKQQIYDKDRRARTTRTCMYDWMNEQVPLLPIKDGTRQRYWVLLHRMRQFGKLMSWDDLTVENIYTFDGWLHGLAKRQIGDNIHAEHETNKIGESAVYNYHRTLRSLISRAVKFGVIERNPYERLRGEFRKGIKENVEYLTEDEIAAIESLRPLPGSQMARARDLFVFQIYTGLSYSDAQAFDIRHYKRVAVLPQQTERMMVATQPQQTMDEGAPYERQTRQRQWRWVAVGNRIKTGVPYVSQLLPQAIEVLERYGWEVPKIGNEQYNAALKTIQQALGITTRLHSHLARHTFATRALAMGVKIQNVSKMLGHTNTRQTERYAKVLAQSVHDDFDMMAAKLSRMNY